MPGHGPYSKNITNAISQIHQLAVMERSDYEISEDFLTLRGALNFFNVCFSNGFIEEVAFTLIIKAIIISMFRRNKTSINIGGACL